MRREVPFRAAATVWTDERALMALDPEHSVGEIREWIIGVSDWDNLLVVVFTQRGERIRIMSARPVTKREREGYVRQC